MDAGIVQICQLPAADLLDAGNAGQIVPLLKQLDGTQRHAARQSVAHEGGPVHQGMVRVIAVKPLVHLMISHRHRVADVSPGERLAQHQDVRQHQVGHKAVAGAPKSGSYLIKDQQHAILVAQLPGPSQEGHVVHTHAPRALEQRLHDKAGKGLPLFCEDPLQFLYLGRDVDHIPLLP